MTSRLEQDSTCLNVTGEILPPIAEKTYTHTKTHTIKKMKRKAFLEWNQISLHPNFMFHALPMATWSGGWGFDGVASGKWVWGMGDHFIIFLIFFLHLYLLFIFLILTFIYSFNDRSLMASLGPPHSKAEIYDYY